MVKCRAGTRDLAKDGGVSATIAIDLGFSKSRASCGVAWGTTSEPETVALTFGDCVGKVAALVREQLRVNLIIEAPLSGFFSGQGSPIERGSFERREATQTERTQTRYWYSGPGATTCLAAIFFLRALLNELRLSSPDASHELTLYEGFASFKTEGTDHVRDARLLFAAFMAGVGEVRDLDVPAAFAAISILDVISGSEEQNLAPAVVIPASLISPRDDRAVGAAARERSV